jgi:uncharacterized membrane protein
MLEIAANSHPIVVHFPIALLTLYSLFELISIRKLQEKHYWFYMKALLVITGFLGAIAALFTGLLSAGQRIGVDALLALHLRFGIAALVIFGFIALLYILAWFGGAKVFLITSKFLFNRGVMIPLALAGLLAVVITGGIGGAMVYGVGFNPLMTPFFNYFNLY